MNSSRDSHSPSLKQSFPLVQSPPSPPARCLPLCQGLLLCASLTRAPPAAQRCPFQRFAGHTGRTSQRGRRARLLLVPTFTCANRASLPSAPSERSGAPPRTGATPGTAPGGRRAPHPHPHPHHPRRCRGALPGRGRRTAPPAASLPPSPPSPVSTRSLRRLLLTVAGAEPRGARRGSPGAAAHPGGAGAVSALPRRGDAVPAARPGEGCGSSCPPRCGCGAALPPVAPRAAPTPGPPRTESGGCPALSPPRPGKAGAVPPETPTLCSPRVPQESCGRCGHLSLHPGEFSLMLLPRFRSNFRDRWFGLSACVQKGSGASPSYYKLLNRNRYLKI